MYLPSTSTRPQHTGSPPPNDRLLSPQHHYSTVSQTQTPTRSRQLFHQATGENEACPSMGSRQMSFFTTESMTDHSHALCATLPPHSEPCVSLQCVRRLQSLSLCQPLSRQNRLLFLESAMSFNNTTSSEIVKSNRHSHPKNRHNISIAEEDYARQVLYILFAV